MQPERIRLPRSDWVGRQFGRWTVIAYDGYYQMCGKSWRHKWKCRCICGTEKSQWQNSLQSPSRSGQCKNCAIKRTEKYHNTGKILPALWYSLVFNANTRGYEVLISPDYAWCLWLEQAGKCALTGRILTLPTKQSEKKSTTASFDRIDSSRNYEPGNVRWVHKDINRMKNVFSDECLLQLCREIVACQDNES